MSNPSLRYLASHARIAIQIGGFSRSRGNCRNARAIKLRKLARLRYEIANCPLQAFVSLRNLNSRVEIVDEMSEHPERNSADRQSTNVELARRVGISPPPCLRRVRTLEEEGYIQGYRGLLDPRRLGFDVTVFASVRLSSRADVGLRAFKDFVRIEPLVRECWMLSGEVDFILKCVAPDMATFQDFVTHLTAAPHARCSGHRWCCTNSKYEAAVSAGGERAEVRPAE